MRCFIFHNLATYEGQGVQIYISMLRGSKVMESKAPNLEGILQTPYEVLYLYLAPLTAKTKTKHFLAMRKDTVAHECVD